MAQKRGEFTIETLKSEDILVGKGGLITIARTKINGKDMLSFTKFFLDTSTGERKFPKGFAVPIQAKDEVLKAIQKVLAE